MTQCRECGTFYRPDLSNSICPHIALKTSDYLQKLRDKGRPYRLQTPAEETRL